MMVLTPKGKASIAEEELKTMVTTSAAVKAPV